MGSLILQNLRNQEYVRLYETIVAGSLFGILGPKFLEILVYPVANKLVPYEEIDPKSNTVNLRQLARLAIIILMVFAGGYGVSRLTAAGAGKAVAGATRRRPS